MQPGATIAGKKAVVVETRPLSPPCRLPSLDGWRALSICLVLGEHSYYTFDCPPRAAKFMEACFDGSLGVRFFFVISGFLITYLLLKEHLESGKISLRNFYARRALRILPVYCAYLLVVFALQLLTPYRQSPLVWIANLTFTTNFVQTNWITGHLWSLAVEEQFYLLWPLALAAARPQNHRRLLCILCLPVIMAPVCRFISDIRGIPSAFQPFFQSYSFLNQFDSLAVGCIAAVLFVHHLDAISALLNRFSRASVLVGATLVLLPQILFKSWIAVYIAMYVSERLTLSLANTFQAIGFSILVLQSIILPRFFKPLNWSLVSWIGALSYSIYIWQMLFCAKPAEFGLSSPWFMSFRFWWVAVLAAAVASYYLLEQPFMSLRRHFRP